MRGKVKNRNIPKPDIKFNSPKIEKFINYIMERGKKNTARKIVYKAFDLVKEKAKVEDPMEIFDAALKNTGPTMEVRSRRVGGANYQVPREVRPERRTYLSMKWIIDAAKAKSGAPMTERLSEEIILASKNEGEAVRKRENVHKMAEANKAFAHFAW
ncbi:MAG: 30S ribosomal protein S7 [Candidatus Zambryskibacteria bacterium]|nr:30S ribosomal protein S7 [Candidatus Zambryskibacteria bacterium]